MPNVSIAQAPPLELVDRLRSILGSLVLPLIVIATLALSACSEDPKTGPVPIKFGRDTCDFCRMIISDPRFAAQVRGGPGHKAYKFDDIGEALVYLSQQPWKDEPAVEIWVMDLDTGKTWLKAKEAQFVPARISPMGFNYGAVTQSRPGAMPFETFRETAMKSKAAELCLTDPNAASKVQKP